MRLEKNEGKTWYNLFLTAIYGIGIPQIDHVFSLFQIYLIVIFNLKKYFYEKRLILSKVVNEIKNVSLH